MTIRVIWSKQGSFLIFLVCGLMFGVSKREDSIVFCPLFCLGGYWAWHFQEANVFRMTCPSSNLAWALLCWCYVCAHCARWFLCSGCCRAADFMSCAPGSHGSSLRCTDTQGEGKSFVFIHYSETAEFLSWCFLLFLNLIFRCPKWWYAFWKTMSPSPTGL